jgi:hypothetical protein
MRKLLVRLGPTVSVESVIVRASDGEVQHRYRLVGGSDDGREFASLTELGAHLATASESAAG